MRLSEVYLSIQGEGPHVGLATVFVRFAGCNLRCPGWPCDTPHAIDPEKFRQEWRTVTPEEVAQEIVEAGRPARQYGVCFTGGEPWLQPSGELDDLINILLHIDGPTNIEAFSNGTLKYSDLAINYVSFVMDWKLPGSGEAGSNHNRHQNFKRLDYGSAVKFTIKDRADYEYASTIYETWKDQNSKVLWYYGVVWGGLNMSTLIDWVLQDGLPWRFTMQVHNYVWNREQRGI